MIERKSRRRDPAALSAAADAPKDTAKTSNAPGSALDWLPCTRRPQQDLRTQLERRRSQSHRSVPLDCGCRDPWPCRCTQPPLSERQLDAWQDAAEHILASGRMPLLPLEVRRALWRRPESRELAALLHEGCGEAIT